MPTAQQIALEELMSQQGTPSETVSAPAQTQNQRSPTDNRQILRPPTPQDNTSLPSAAVTPHSTAENNNIEDTQYSHYYDDVEDIQPHCHNIQVVDQDENMGQVPDCVDLPYVEIKV